QPNFTRANVRFNQKPTSTLFNDAGFLQILKKYPTLKKYFTHIYCSICALLIVTAVYGQADSIYVKFKHDCEIPTITNGIVHHPDAILINSLNSLGVFDMNPAFPALE